MMKFACAVLFLLLGCSCSEEESKVKPGTQTGTDPLIVSMVPTPGKQGSEVSRVGIGSDGRFHMSWVEPTKDKNHALRLAFLKDGQWTEPETVAEGSHWMVNWADFPSVVGGEHGNMAAHWLEYNENRLGYGVRTAVSLDGGVKWGEPFWLHSEVETSEHGFVSIVPVADGTFRAAWLDSRSHALSGNMELWSVQFDSKGRVGAEIRIDERTCECCGTSAVLADGTPVLVYRDREEGEVRDISVTRFADSKWSKPTTVHVDHWEMPG